MSPQITDDDVGKSVVNADGDEVGMVADVQHGTAHVEPDPGITDSIKATLGWGDSGEDTYPLQEEAIGRVTDDEIRLERDLSGANTTGGTGDMDTGTGTTGTDTGTGTTGTGTGTTDDRGIDRDENDISGSDDEGVIRDDNDDDLLGDDDDDDDLLGDDNTR